MQRRFLASWRGVLLATAFASLIVASFSFVVAAPAPQATVASGDSSGGLGTVIGQETNPFRLKTFPRTNYQWPFAAGPHYGGQDLEIAPGVLRTRVGSFDLRGARQSNIPAELTAADRFADLGVQYYVLMLDPASFGDGSFDGLQQSIEVNGGALVKQVPVSGFIARMTPAALAAVQASPAVIAAQPYHPAYKLDTLIGRAPLADPFRAVSDVYDLEVMIHAGENAGATATRLAEMGGNVLSVFGDTIRVEIDRGHLAAIARLESVFAIGERLPIYPKAEETTNSMQTGSYCPLGPCGPLPYHAAGIDGGGADDANAFRVHVLDTGFQLDNGDLSDTKTNAGSFGPTHRKVEFYGSTNPFGGAGDLLGCDASSQGAFTHGHTAAATTLGWATDVDEAYDDDGDPLTPPVGFTALDTGTGRLWKLDGVAPRARLVAFDAQETPSLVSCGDPSADGIFPGDIYNGIGSNTALEVAYATHGALDHNFSWGNTNLPSYGSNASKIDNFLFDRRDAMVFVSAGNEGSDDDNDLLNDLNTVSNPASCKSCLSIGATGAPNDLGTGTQDHNDRFFFSSVGPATTAYTTGAGCPGSLACDLVDGGGRIAPILMAPGGERGNMGIDSEFNCRSQDNDQSNPVECDIVSGVAGTSFASPAAAGAAVLVRDYFANGFYPSASANVGDRQPSISGALVKAALIASADWVGNGNTPGTNNTYLYRANNEQGYGRIQLDNLLPLQTWSRSPIGMIVADESGFPVNNTTLDGIAANGTTDTTNFTVSDVTSELRVALAWTETSGELATNNLDLELVAPDGTTYYGNYFTEDWNRNNALDAGEDCPGFDGSVGTLDQFPWSLPVCGNSNRDIDNVSEAIMLSPDPDDDGETADGLSQIQPGEWTLNVIGTTVVGADQPYAVVISGGVAVTSSVRFSNGAPVCNDIVGLTVNETDETTDPGIDLTPAEIASRIVVDVLVDGVVVDTEPGDAFTWSQPEALALRFIAEDIILSAGTAADPGNGALDIGDGATLRVTYNDEANGAPDPTQVRISTSTVDCSAAIGFGNLVFGAFGRDTLTFVEGGCERNGRDSFEFGFPDRYIDNDEQVSFGIAFFNDDGRTLVDAEADLRCVLPDGDSPAECLPGTTDCGDPNRLNNPPCTGLSILDSPKIMGDIPAGSAVAAIFTIEATAVAPNTEVEMVLGISSPTSGKSTAGYAVSRQVLEADEQVFYYSTDYPTGGTENRDYNNSETLEITTSAEDFFSDYRFEERTWSDATATGRNGALQSPWNFDTNNGGFVSGIGATSTADLGVGNLVANWGEDKNFNNVLDAGEDREPAGQTGILDQNWSVDGGCGWQSGTVDAGGVWHTGTIRTPTSGGGKTCLFDAANNGKCQSYEIIIGTTGVKTWFEILLTPVVEQVNDGYRLEHINWAWNLNSELNDQFAAFTWEFDTDTTTAEPVDLTADLSIFNAFSGPSGPIDNTNNPGLYRPNVFGVASEGFSMFAPSNATGSGPGNGTVGNNRVGDWSCFFDSKGLDGVQIGPAGPPDDDLDNDNNGQFDEFVALNGPIRNFDLTVFNGPDMRFTTLEDIYGPSGATFQGALGFFLAEDNDGAAAPNPAPGYGVAFDDMVMEWKEINVVPDATDCATGQCATLNLDVSNFFEGSAILNVTLTDRSPEASNDCNQDGFPDGTRDCDGNLVDDVPVEVYNDNRVDTEIIFLNEISPGSGVYRGQVSISAVADVDALEPWDPGNKTAYAPGTLFVQRNGTDLPSVNVDYQDNDDGTGVVCDNDIDPAGRGLVSAGTAVIYPSGLLKVVKLRVEDNGDSDGIADTNETLNVFLTLNNNSGADLNNVVARISTNDPNIECITQPVVNVGALTDGQTAEAASAFVVKVSPSANRTSTFGEFSADFTISLSSDEFAATFSPEVATLDLDLNIATGGGAPGNFLEDFDSDGTTFGQFTSMTLDASAKGSNANSDGYRCQYNDPDFINANSYGNTDCALEHLVFQPLVFDWHNHDQGDLINAPDGGRAFSGTNSLHFGSHNGNPDDDTTSFGQLDAVRTTNAIHLSNTLTSELSFKAQISVVDDRTVNAPGGETPDRVVVMVRQADNGGTGTGDWIKIAPYANVYDRQGTDNFFECMFDPIDDGSTEDDFFDPLDPDRRLGPSSTCFPEFVFAFLGDTDHRNTFNEGAIGRASDGPGLQGSIDRGTWVEPKFDLSRFQGRSLFVRFVYTTIQVQPGILTVEQLFDLPNGWPGDDGAYFDDVQVTNTVSTANTVSIDTTDNSGLDDLPSQANCDANCSTLSAVLSATDNPSATTPAPGHVIQLTAADSTADACVDGVIQYQWWLDNGDGVIDTGVDTLLRDFTDDAFFVFAPLADGKYAVRARCSSAPSCADDAFLDVTVTCPASGNLGFAQSIGFNSKTQIGWDAAATVDAVRGNLDTLRSSGTYTGAIQSCVANDVNTTTIDDATAVAPGSGLFWLVKGSSGGSACNAISTYGNASAGTGVDRDSEIGADANACP